MDSTYIIFIKFTFMVMLNWRLCQPNEKRAAIDGISMGCLSFIASLASLLIFPSLRRARAIVKAVRVFV